VSEVSTLAVAALGITLVSYSSDVATATGVASKNRYRINANQEFTAMGFANIAAGISQGFVVCGADSRTAVSDSMGGKTQMTGVFAAITIIAVLLFLTGPIAYLPVPVLGAVLISAAVGLFNFNALMKLWHVNPPEFFLSILTTLGVITIGLLPGILIAVNLALIKLLGQASHPHDAILGRARGHDVYQDISEYPDNEIIPGLVIYRFDSALVFFNANYFRNRIHEVIANTSPKPQWFLLDAEPINNIDVTGVTTLDEIITEMESRGITFTIARMKGEVKSMLNKAGVLDRVGKDHIFSSVREGFAAFTRNHSRQ
jgi:MFS superfamily sulfate permease-like transporter